MTTQPSFSPPGSSGSSPNPITCHVCLREFQPDLTSLFERKSGKTVPLVIPPGSSAALRAELMRNALVQCPSNEPKIHHLPVDFVRYKTPIVIGLVGRRGTGKSTLLASMIDEIERKNGLRDYGLRARPLVPDKHEQFRSKYLDNLDNGQTLDATPAAAEDVDYANGILLIKGGETPQPVIFWDVGGESFTQSNEDVTRFIQAFTALVFVVDPATLVGTKITADRTFRRVFDRLYADSGTAVEYLDKPAAIVLAKADKMRFDIVVARWLTQRTKSGEIHPERIRAESQDIYAFLYQAQASWALVPFDVFRRCTLHVVSATGSNAPEPEQSGANSVPLPAYIRPMRTRRVLEPLVAILAMAGAIVAPGADEVGR